MANDIAWTIPGHHPLAGTKRGIDEVLAFCADQHLADLFFWKVYQLKPIPARLT